MPYRIITIEFKYSISPQFRFALEEAKKQISFQAKDGRYSVTYKPRDYEALHRLITYLTTLRNKSVYVDGQIFPWQEIFHYLNCYRLREKSYDKKQYCMGDSRQFPAFNPWRCIQAMMPLSKYAEWLHYGKFDLDGTFIFNKDQIKHYLLANTHAFRFCPILNQDTMLKILEAFPETANPRIDPDWQFSGSIGSRLAVGISLSTGQGKESQCTGVAPTSYGAIKRIYQKILDKL